MSQTVANARELTDFLCRLRAVRRFRPEPVQEDVVEDILRVARLSGSAVNKQPWELVVVRDRGTLRALGAASPNVGHVAEATIAIMLVMAGDPAAEQLETFDEGRLSERIMLAALAHGVGSCIAWFMGPAQQRAKEILGIPQERLVRTAISLGYALQDESAPRSKQPAARKPLEAIVHRERFS